MHYDERHEGDTVNGIGLSDLKRGVCVYFHVAVPPSERESRDGGLDTEGCSKEMTTNLIFL